jgi:hypothetical protein
MMRPLLPPDLPPDVVAWGVATAVILAACGIAGFYYTGIILGNLLK